jgi:molybdate transport system substrate-binding protein
LQETGFAVAGTRFSYALGCLLLWSPQPGLAEKDPAELLRDPTLHRLAIANPALAPYGRAARQALEALDAWEALSGRIVFGENVAQAFTMAASGNAQLALVGASLVPDGSGTGLQLATSLYDPIRQDAVLLKHGADNPAAREFLRFLRSASARNYIRAAGYEVD